MQAALSWYRETGAVGSLLQLGGELFFFWQLRSRLREGRAWLEWGLAQDAEIPDPARAMGQLGLSGILFAQHELAGAMPLGEESLVTSGPRRCRGDREGGRPRGCIALCRRGGASAAAAYTAESLAALVKVEAAPWSLAPPVM